MFRKSWSRKRQEPANRFRKRKTISFRCDPETELYLNALKDIKARSNFINEAIKTYYNLVHARKRFFLDQCKAGFFTMMKHVVRQFGRAHKENLKLKIK